MCFAFILIDTVLIPIAYYLDQTALKAVGLDNDILSFCTQQRCGSYSGMNVWYHELAAGETEKVLCDELKSYCDSQQISFQCHFTNHSPFVLSPAVGHFWTNMDEYFLDLPTSNYDGTKGGGYRKVLDILEEFKSELGYRPYSFQVVLPKRISINIPNPLGIPNIPQNVLLPSEFIPTLVSESDSIAWFPGQFPKTPYQHMVFHGGHSFYIPDYTSVNLSQTRLHDGWLIVNEVQGFGRYAIPKRESAAYGKNDQYPDVLSNSNKFIGSAWIIRTRDEAIEKGNLLTAQHKESANNEIYETLGGSSYQQ